MDTQKLKDFMKDLFTLRTVWIDRGQGQWTVKKRLHPLLRGAFWTLGLIVCTTTYAAFHEVKLVTKSDMVMAQAPTPELMITVPEETAQTMIPIAMTRNTIILPSEENPNLDRIIAPSEPVEIIPEEPAPRVFDMADDGKYRILVSKAEYKLWLLKGNELVHEYAIATGQNPGDKQRVGDHRTPVGNFKITAIQDASKWSHDFGDGKGKIKGAYGPWFLRLDANGWKGIGIHGTHDPDSRGTMATEGCIRLSNEDIDELKQYAYKNMPVIIREN